MLGYQVLVSTPDIRMPKPSTHETSDVDASNALADHLLPIASSHGVGFVLTNSSTSSHFHACMVVGLSPIID